jgi:hypothetical protein
MIVDISQKREREFSALWNSDRFELHYMATLDGYLALIHTIEKSKNPDEIKLAKWFLPQMKNAIVDMNAFRAAKTAGEAA